MHMRQIILLESVNMKRVVFIILIFVALALFISAFFIDFDNFDDFDNLASGKEEQPVANDNVVGVKMTATVKGIGDKIEVEVIEGEYGASGIYWVNYSEETVFADSENLRVSISNLKVGDTVEITYGGQVAMSYPPQIFASKILIK